MFIINNNEIDKEFSKTSWEHDYCHFMETSHNRDAAKYDTDIAETFAQTMKSALHYAAKNEASISGYLTVREHMLAAHMSPADFEYGIFGNIAAGAVDSDVDINKLASIGYIPTIIKIVSNEPDTVVYFNDDTKVVVHCSDKDTFDAEKGIYLAILKKALGSPNLQHLFTLIADKCKAKSPAASAENVDESDSEVSYSTDENGKWYEEGCSAE